MYKCKFLVLELNQYIRGSREKSGFSNACTIDFAKSSTHIKIDATTMTRPALHL